MALGSEFLSNPDCYKEPKTLTFPKDGMGHIGSRCTAWILPITIVKRSRRIMMTTYYVPWA